MEKKKHLSFMKAAGIQFASKYINVALQLVITAVLARLLTPEQYGVVAGITVFTSFFGLLADMGFGPAIIQYKQLKDNDYGGIFIFTICLSFVLAGAFAALSGPIALFFRNDSYRSLCVLCTISVFFGGINMVPNGLLLKDKQFFVIGFRLVIGTLVGGCIAIALALHGFGASSLIWNLNVTAVFVFIWNYISVYKLISFRDMHIFESIKVIIRYAIYQAGFSFINYFSRNLDHILVGRYFGSAPLGLYDKAYKLTSYPITFIPGVLGTVIQPYLSYYQNNKKKLFYYQMVLVRFLALAGCLAMFICLLCGKDIVYIMYGAQWMNCVPLFTILAASIAFQMVMNVTGSILQSAGRTDLLFRQGLFATIIMVTFTIGGCASRKLTILTICVSTAFFFQLFTVAYYTAVKAFDESMAAFLMPVLRIIFISFAIAIPFFAIRYILHFTIANGILNLLMYTIAYATLFVLVFLRTGDLKAMLRLMKKKA